MKNVIIAGAFTLMSGFVSATTLPDCNNSIVTLDFAQVVESGATILNAPEGEGLIQIVPVLILVMMFRYHKEILVRWTTDF